MSYPDKGMNPKPLYNTFLISMGVVVVLYINFLLYNYAYLGYITMSMDL